MADEEVKEKTVETPVFSTTKNDRPEIEIDGKRYKLSLLDDFSLKEGMKLRRDGIKFSKISQSEDPSDEEADWAQNFLDTIVQKIVIDIEEDIANKLSTGQKVEIVNFFTSPVPEQTEQTTNE